MISKKEDLRAYMDAMHETQHQMKKALCQRLIDGIAEAMPTIKVIEYEWNNEYDDDGGYHTYVSRIVLNLINGDEIDYYYGGGEIEYVGIRAGGDTVAVPQEAEHAVFVAAGMVDGDAELLSFLTHMIDTLIDELGDHVTEINIDADRTKSH